MSASPLGSLGVWKMLGISLGAFAFAFSMVPLYRITCEKVFGIRLEKGPDAAAVAAAPTDGRWVTVQFDGGVNSKLPWRFAPKQNAMRVQVGRQYEALFAASNVSDRAIVGNAVPSIAPARASRYFNKTECFCFTEQVLKAGETRRMPVRFFVDPRLPADVRELTLSYTFYANEAATRRLLNSASPPPAAG